MSDYENEAADLFEEPDGYYEPEKEPTFEKYRSRITGQELILRLVGRSPLWGHLLWQAGRTLADYLEANSTALVDDKTVLEVGAGAGLPSLICSLHGAKKVVVSDYPDADLIANLQYNVEVNKAVLPSPHNIEVEGHLWGAPNANLIQHLPAGEQDEGFDLLILADLLFNHSEHAKLLSTVRSTLKMSCGARALVFFTPYRPWLLEKDLAFFKLATEDGFAVQKVFEKVMEKVMFEEDPGDELLRRTVFGYIVRWPLDAVRASAKST